MSLTCRKVQILSIQNSHLDVVVFFMDLWKIMSTLASVYCIISNVCILFTVSFSFLRGQLICCDSFQRYLNETELEHKLFSIADSVKFFGAMTGKVAVFKYRFS